MSGDEFLKLANALFSPFVGGNKPANEALFRTVVNRAYYGAFHLAKGFLKQLGFPTSGHGDPPKYLQASNEPKAKRAGELLATFYTIRWNADYELTKPIVIDDFRNFKFVRDQLERAQDIHQLLIECSTEMHRSSIKAGIEKQLKKAPKGGSY